jgi:hypothetical protein
LRDGESGFASVYAVAAIEGCETAALMAMIGVVAVAART